MRTLQDDAEVRLIPCQPALVEVVAIDEDLAASRLVEARRKIDDGALTAATSSDERDGLARLDG